MKWNLSAWNTNETTTDFYSLLAWDVYVTDEHGTKYEQDSISTFYVEPRPGERQEFSIVFPPAQPGAYSLTLHPRAEVRSCLLGWCNDPITWQSVTISISEN